MRVLAGTAYGVAAVVLAVIAVLARRREAHNQNFAVALTCVMAGASWWAAADAVAVASTNQTDAAIGSWLRSRGRASWSRPSWASGSPLPGRTGCCNAGWSSRSWSNLS